MASYDVTEAAADDLKGIDDYLLVNDGVDAAERVSRALEEAFDLLAGQPMVGHRRRDLIARPYRFWSAMGFLIIYDADASPIRIVRVLHGRRDVTAVLGG